jgi:hypothetical protein
MQHHFATKHVGNSVFSDSLRKRWFPQRRQSVLRHLGRRGLVKRSGNPGSPSQSRRSSAIVGRSVAGQTMILYLVFCSYGPPMILGSILTRGGSKRLCRHQYSLSPNFSRRWLISNKGTQDPIEFWPSAYAQRIFGYSAAPSMGPSLVSPIWGLIAEELEGYQ